MGTSLSEMKRAKLAVDEELNVVFSILKLGRPAL